MPIQGILNETELSRYPSLGKLRKGGAKTEKGGPGKDLETFRFTSDQADVQECFNKAFGETPVTLTVFMPYKRLDDNFSTWKEEWEGGGLVHRCDGVTCTLWWDKASKTYSHKAKPCPGGCKPVGRLNFFVPELLKAGFVGFVTMETHGKHDIRSILLSLSSVVNDRGAEDLTGIAFTLRRAKGQISYLKQDGTRAHRGISFVQLVPAVEWVRRQLTAQRALVALPSGIESIPEARRPGTVIDSETGEIIEPVDAEFEEETEASGELEAGGMVDTDENKDDAPAAEKKGDGKLTPLEVHLEWTERFLAKAIPAMQKVFPGFSTNDALDALDVVKLAQVAERRANGDRDYSARSMQAKLLAYAQELADQAASDPLGEEPAGVTSIETEERF